MGLNPDPDSPQIPLEGLSNSNFELINEGIYRYRWVNLTTGETIADVVSSNPMYDVPDVSVNLGIGTYEFELTVWDQYGFTASDKTSVSILEDPYEDGGHGSGDDGFSEDPNELIGPSGKDGWILGEETLAYQINYENDETATAPAQRVDMEMYLDEDLDWSTFQFTGFGWADIFEGLGNGSYTINKRIETSVIPLGEEDPVTIYVEVNAGIDLLSGRVYATFQTLQYTTLDGALEEEELLAPMSANIGFLLPSVKEDGEKVDSRGDGFLTYIVKAKKPLVTNTEITSVANIQFDFGEIIATNQIDPHDPSQGTDPAKEVPLKIDADAPTAILNELPEQTTEKSVTLSWVGQDEGSGIAFYDLYVSINGGNFELVEGGLNVTEYEYTFPSKNTTYSFKVVATDNVGWVEVDNQAEVTTNYGIPTDVIYCLTTTPSDLNSHVVSANESPINEWNTVNLEFWSDFTTTETFTIAYDSTMYELNEETSRNQAGVVLTFGESQTDENGLTTVEITIDCTENIEIGINTLLASLEFTPIRNLLVGESVETPIFVNDLPLDTMVYSVIYDLNESGNVEINDLVAFARLFGQVIEDHPDAWVADFNCDGTIVIDDLVLFARNFGLTTKTSNLVRYDANYTPHIEETLAPQPAAPVLETSVAWETPTWSGTTQNLVPEPAAALPTITDRAWNDLWSELEEEEEERLAEQRRVTEFAWE
ncbi:MAG: hypothetical protein Q4A17_15340 [Thermoguttaceae bacterium]|nr:hypothetical protein [Thermoguttaceae bacterium]